MENVDFIRSFKPESVRWILIANIAQRISKLNGDDTEIILLSVNNTLMSTVPKKIAPSVLVLEKRIKILASLSVHKTKLVEKMRKYSGKSNWRRILGGKLRAVSCTSVQQKNKTDSYARSPVGGAIESGVMLLVFCRRNSSKICVPS